MSRPAWADWQGSAEASIGVEEELMLLHREDWGLAERSHDVLAMLPEELAAAITPETHRGALELATTPHATVGAAVAQLRALREGLVDTLAPLGLGAAGAGTHPTSQWHDTQISAEDRYREIERTMRALARREPTFALHVHVGVDDPDAAIGLMDRMRVHLPLLLALSANSPFWQGRDTGLASARTTIFQAFPRTGLPRAFGTYAHWWRTVDEMLRCGAFPEPSFLWWDVRPQPRFGTVEVRIMDTQADLAHTAALCALVQSVARLELAEGYAPEAMVAADEVLAENRFLATRDGVDAAFLDPASGACRPARTQLGELLAAAAPHAADLGCAAELDGLRAVLAEPGAARQRHVAEAGDGAAAIAADLAARFLD